MGLVGNTLVLVGCVAVVAWLLVKIVKGLQDDLDKRNKK